jgi:hypothetical protein
VFPEAYIKASPIFKEGPKEDGGRRTIAARTEKAEGGRAAESSPAMSVALFWWLQKMIVYL